jgi:manganese efflux pump family protein
MDLMSQWTLLLIALGLAVDAFAVAVATSIALVRVSPRQVFRLAFHFGLFQALMPIVGWLLGCGLGALVQSWDHWVAFGLLAFVGGRACWEALGDDATCLQYDPTRGWSLVMLAVATSLDALAIGVSLAFLGVAIWYPCVIIGLVAAVLTTVGMLAGTRIGAHFGRRVAFAGGLILIGIGFKVLVSV